MSTNQENTHSALPTLAEVRRFMEHHLGQLAFIGQQATPKPYAASLILNTHSLNGQPQTKFTASLYGNDAKAYEDTPEAAVAAIAREIGPEAKAAHIAKLRAEIEELEKEAA